jgi:hypothetical protein
MISRAEDITLSSHPRINVFAERDAGGVSTLAIYAVAFGAVGFWRRPPSSVG